MWYRISSFLRYYLRAGTAFNVQSPYLHDFVQHVLDADKEYYAYMRLEQVRKRLLNDESRLSILDHGAGSTVSPNGKERKVKDIASTALSRADKCRILFQMIDHYRFKNILELGTSLGLSSAYMAWASLEGKVTTLEGDPSIAQHAQKLHDKIGLKNTKIVVGKFEDTLDSIIKENDLFDLIFIDGHHSEEPTLAYFEKLLHSCSAEGLLIFDDIYWSSGMTRAWEIIKSHPQVTMTIDLYDIGIVSINKSLSKENFTYIPYHYKPWRIGLFGKD